MTMLACKYLETFGFYHLHGSEELMLFLKFVIEWNNFYCACEIGVKLYIHQSVNIHVNIHLGSTLVCMLEVKLICPKL